MLNVSGSAGANQATLAPLESTITLPVEEQQPGDLAGREVTMGTHASTGTEVSEILKQATRLSDNDVGDLIKANIIKDVVLRQGPCGTVVFDGIKPEHQLSDEAIELLVAIANRNASSASPLHFLSLAACAPEIDQRQLDLLETRIEKVANDLENHYWKNPTLLLDASLGRFYDVNGIKQTAVGKDLSANQITIAGKKIAIATQYPKDDQIARQLDMYMTQGVNTVVVLSSDNDFNDPRPERKITDYFSKSGFFADPAKGSKIKIATTVQQRKSEKLADDGELRVYQMTLRNAKGQQKQMQVLHLANWPDGGVISARDTLELAQLLKGRNVAVHCTAGVGRTGELIGVMAMNELQQQPSKPSLESIITEMRQQRSLVMVQTEGQRKIMAEVAIGLGFPIVS